MNGIVLIWSLFLLLKILATLGTNNDDKQTVIEFEYLVYNFGTCAVWVVEVLFNVLDFKGYFKRDGVEEESPLQPNGDAQTSERTKKEVIALHVEALLAVYFFIDSTIVADNLSRKQIHKEARGMTIDVVINMLAYCYMVHRQFVDWRASHSSGLLDNVSPDGNVRLNSEGLV